MSTFFIIKETYILAQLLHTFRTNAVGIDLMDLITEVNRLDRGKTLPGVKLYSTVLSEFMVKSVVNSNG